MIIKLLIILLIINFKITYKEKIIKEENIKITNITNKEINQVITNKDKESITKIEKNIGFLKIDKINLSNKIYDINSKHNNIEENVTILKTSENLKDKNSLVVLAAHSGEGRIAYFNKLIELSEGDEIEFKYYDETYIYVVDNIYEQEKNEEINKAFQNNPNDASLYAQKTKSDDIMNRISSDIALANQRMQENTLKELLGAAFVVKYEGRVTIIISGYNKDFQGIDIKTYIFYKIIEEYKKAGYLYLDMYGITADFTDTNPYKELNDFKLKFKPTVYEYIGEFDLIVNKPFHQLLWSTNKIQKEFYKPAIKRTGVN